MIFRDFSIFALTARPGKKAGEGRVEREGTQGNPFAFWPPILPRALVLWYFIFPLIWYAKSTHSQADSYMTTLFLEQFQFREWYPPKKKLFLDFYEMIKLIICYYHMIVNHFREVEMWSDRLKFLRQWACFDRFSFKASSQQFKQVNFCSSLLNNFKIFCLKFLLL